ncbi:MAG: hypothetical protein OEU50_11100 [Gammaproteobacteria bacterium]|nr:hypothetical protein [Gammaproteobacteria bacterium]
MQRKARNYRNRDYRTRLRLLDRLLYLPGAMLLAYGFWLSLTT